MALKRRISRLYAKANDRAYNAVYTKQGRSDKGLKSSMTLRNFESGTSSLRWTSKTRLVLYSSQKVQVIEKLMDKARVCLMRLITKVIPKEEFLLRFPVIPHQILRNHSMASGAKADRISQGMANSFGKPLQLAARVREGQGFLQLYLSPKGSKELNTIKGYLSSLKPRFPFKGYVLLDSNPYSLHGTR